MRGAAATPERPLAWATMEPNRNMGMHNIGVRSWPGYGDERILATSHPHTTRIDMAE